MFKNRQEAAQQLSKKLLKYKKESGIVLGIPRGGVPLAKVIAEELDWPLELVLSKKIPHPLQKEYAMGSVSMTGRLINDMAHASPEYIDQETHRIREQLREQYRWYFKNRTPHSYTNKVVIIVDDGMATGYTMLSTVELIAQHKPKLIVVAIPVASPSAIKLIDEYPGKQEIACILADGSFFSVSQYYEDFSQVTDEEVKAMMGNGSNFESQKAMAI